VHPVPIFAYGSAIFSTEYFNSPSVAVFPEKVELAVEAQPVTATPNTSTTRFIIPDDSSEV